MNKNPIEARRAPRKKARKGTLEDVSRKVYAVLERGSHPTGVGEPNGQGKLTPTDLRP